MLQHPSSFMSIFNETVAGLAYSYGRIKKIDYPLERFLSEIMSVVRNLDNSDVHDLHEIVKQFVSNEDKEKGREYLFGSATSALLVATTFLVRASNAYQSNVDLGWSYMADARYWYGAVRSSDGIEKSYKETVVTTKRDTASKGAKARNEKIAPVKFYAQELARKYSPKNGGWTSKNQAVQRIKEEVRKFAHDAGVNLSANQADVTIRKWLSDMPDVSVIFPAKNVRAKVKK